MPQSACDEIAMPKAKTKAASANTYAILGSDESEVKRVAAELSKVIRSKCDDRRLKHFLTVVH